MISHRKEGCDMMIIRGLSADEKERRRIERYEDSLHDDATLRDSWEKSIVRSMKAAGLDEKTIDSIITNSRGDHSGTARV